MISSFSAISHGTNRSVQQVCQLIADNKDVCNHLLRCCRSFSKCCLAQLVCEYLPQISSSIRLRWEDEVFIQQEKKGKMPKTLDKPLRNLTKYFPCGKQMVVEIRSRIFKVFFLLLCLHQDLAENGSASPLSLCVQSHPGQNVFGLKLPRL